ncbi:MAG: 4Fe-4S dicluster domain-containing protein [Acidobacteriota bacterium]
MTHVVTERCVDCRYTDCCTVCPVECFWEITDPHMLVIDPDTCIDCELCIPECPINAIWPEAELPEAYTEWTDKNRDLFAAGTNITKNTGALEGALTLDQLKAREKERGWTITEPSKANH